MPNELILIITAVVLFGFVRYCFYQGRRWLHASIVINLILISVFGAKLIYTFGFVTNVGNIFYVMVFFAAQLLVEHYGKEEGGRSVWLGLGSVALFILIGQLVVKYAGAPESVAASNAIASLFKLTPRVALASILAYAFAQSLNVGLYGYLREQRGMRLWQRSILATCLGQLLDSLVFFTIAFLGTIPGPVLLQTMMAGFLFKTSLGIASIPFLYSSYTVKTKKEILEEEAEAILFGIGDGLVMTDRDGKIITANKAFEEMIGWKAGEVEGKQTTDVLKRYDEAGNEVLFKERILTRVLAGEKIVTPMTNHTYLARKDGTKFPVRIIVTPILIDRTIMGAVEVFQDVSKEKEIENLRNDFLSLASHQLRTPLSSTRWLIETMKSGILGELNKKQKEYADNIYQINSRMIQLVSDMLNVLHIESDSIRVVKERFPLTKIYDEAMVMVQATAKEKGVIVENGLKDRAIMVETDPKLAKSIVEAFISNAVSYTYSGGKVVLDGKDLGNEVVAIVKDNGVGIPRDEQKRIFERFYRASNASRMKTDGTGLGLYIAWVLAKKIGAKITFESSEGQGSAFYLHIPKGQKEK